MNKPKTVPAKRRLGYSPNERKRAVWGLLFIFPWLIGAVAFFVIPLIETLWDSLNNINITPNGLKLSFIGFSNYKDIFVTDATFNRQFVTSLVSMLVNVPIIVFFSLFTAIILKDKFFGRTVFRAIFFLPVIIASGVVITVLKENVMTSGMNSVASTHASYIFSAPSFSSVFANIGVPSQILNFITDIINRLFDLTWKSGVQILLLLAAVNNIPRSSYEAADMEGANAWEKFWKITFALVSPTILVTVIYSIIDSFTDYSNPIIRAISTHFSNGKYAYSSAVGFTYFISILLIIGVIYFIISRRVFYEND